MRDCSEVSPYALLLAARTLKQAHAHDAAHHHTDHDHAGTLLLDEDGWVRFAAVGRIGALVAALKRRVDALLGASLCFGGLWRVCVCASRDPMVLVSSAIIKPPSASTNQSTKLWKLTHASTQQPCAFFGFFFPTEAKVQDPSVDIATAPEAQALVKLIATEGMG